MFQSFLSAFLKHVICLAAYKNGKFKALFYTIFRAPVIHRPPIQYPIAEMIVER